MCLLQRADACFLCVQDFVSQLGLQPGQRVLDVGCGLGGGDFYMAAEHGVSVRGIDLSVNIMLLATQIDIRYDCLLCRTL